MKIQISITLISITFFISCNTHDAENKTFEPNELDNAWATNNRSVLNRWIKSLGNKKLSDKEFFTSVAYLSSTTKFLFGNTESDSTSWQQTSQSTREIIRQNIATVYNCYLESCLFLNKKVTWNDTEPLQTKFYSNMRLLSDQDIRKLKEELDLLCIKNRE